MYALLFYKNEKAALPAPESGADCRRHIPLYTVYSVK